jgi:demethylmenaquinone methyltransferase/2-methoxy-6-polyprenyl-1,4-benzoquinol methylase
MTASVRNRIKFALAGDALELVNPWIPGGPHAELVRRAAQGPISAALELCAGTGYASRLLASAHPLARVYALDSSPEMLAVGRRKLAGAGLDNVTLVHGDAADLQFADASLDVVMSVFGMHELPTPVRRRAVTECARVLRPGGRFVAVDVDRPRGPGGLVVDAYLRAAEPRDARDVLGAGLADLLTEAGFTIDDWSPATGVRPTQAITARR